MSARPSSAALLALGACLLGVTVWIWRWQAGISPADDLSLKAEPWDGVKQRYPAVEEAIRVSPLSVELIETVVSAQPFSPQRRLTPTAQPSAGGEDAVGAPEPAAPVFRFKGRINVGARQRAIIEETTGGKTHFLEVGQDVAGFKVLDIAENRVVLSDIHTHEELIVSLFSPGGPEQ
jgi:hypothetical protein